MNDDPNRFEGAAAGDLIAELQAELERVKHYRREDARAYRRDIARLSAFVTPTIDATACAYLVINDQGYITNALTDEDTAAEVVAKATAAGRGAGLRVVPVYAAATITEWVARRLPNA